MNKVLCIMGPTAAGKTDIAIELADREPYQIISVDSAMVYRHMDIGTAKPDAQTLAKAPHQLIDIIEPEQSYSAADFVADATHEIEACFAAGKKPLLVGGTMLYFKALQQGLSEMPAADPDIRAAIVAEAEQQGWEAMHTQLQQVDSEAAAMIHPNDPQRLQRALEIYRITGKTRSKLWQEQQSSVAPYDFVNIAVYPDDRTVLHERIAKRFMHMLDQGFIGEVESLRQRPELTLQHPSMRCVGYRQVWQYLQGEFDRDTMIEKGIAATRQLAKRQLTWLRSWPNVNRFVSIERLLSS